jgi:hypothetical protein
MYFFTTPVVLPCKHKQQVAYPNVHQQPRRNGGLRLAQSHVSQELLHCDQQSSTDEHAARIIETATPNRANYIGVVYLSQIECAKRSRLPWLCGTCCKCNRTAISRLHVRNYRLESTCEVQSERFKVQRGCCEERKHCGEKSECGKFGHTLLFT